jgi:undecaprenyl pyrophosphate synthase
MVFMSLKQSEASVDDAVVAFSDYYEESAKSLHDRLAGRSLEGSSRWRCSHSRHESRGSRNPGNVVATEAEERKGRERYPLVTFVGYGFFESALFIQQQRESRS